MEPKVSICIPTYNQVDKLQILLDSIRIQTFRDFEVIVSDDSSTDDVKQLVDRYDDLNIRYYRNSPAKGSPENWNHAISLAKCGWIKLMHHDDCFYTPFALKRFIAYAEGNPSIDFVFCGTSIRSFPSTKREIYYTDKKRVEGLNKHFTYLTHQNLVGSPSVVLFRKSDFLPFDKHLKWLVDIEYYISILKTKNHGYIDDVLIETMESESQLTQIMRNNPTYEVVEFFYCYSKHYTSINKLNKKILNLRMLDLFNQFNIHSVSALSQYLNNGAIPRSAKFYFFLARINSRMANSVFYRLNKFSI